MAAAARLEDGCPRCGGKLEEDGRSFALCAACGAFWTSESSFQRESIARGLAGTRSRKYDSDYLEGEEGEEGTLSSDLTELVALVRVTAFEEVVVAVRLAIAGRNGITAYDEGALHTLQGMEEWLLKRMEDGYGNE